MRTGAEYRAALRDGRKVVIMGGGEIEDVTTHPATAPMSSVRRLVDSTPTQNEQDFDQPRWYAMGFHCLERLKVRGLGGVANDLPQRRQHRTLRSVVI